MSELRRLLANAVSNQSRETDVALLLSAGRDSITVGIACQDAGKRIHAYTFELEGYRSHERERAEAIAHHLGWKLTVVTVPTHNLPDDFKRLAIGLGCRKKVHFEVSFPLQYVLSVIEESEIWTGWNADDHYGNNREYMFEQRRLKEQGLDDAARKEHFDAYRLATYQEFDRPGSNHTFWKASEIAERRGKRLCDPYTSPDVRAYFCAFDHHRLSPLSKPLIRDAFNDVFVPSLEKLVAKGERLQKGGRVDELFETLLENADINRFDKKYRGVSPLCLKWGAAIRANPEAFAKELNELPPQPRAITRTSDHPYVSNRVAGLPYVPYRMIDVAAVAAQNKFTVISTFAGGGGSSTGYSLAGGKLLRAIEFVEEAARTYRANFPGCAVDLRDIRKISASDQKVAAFLASTSLNHGELDVLDGSPPCSEFSTAGRGIGDQDRLRVYSDVRQNNIASLCFDLADLLIRAKPKVFICENVPAFASRGKEVFDRFLHAIRFPDGRAYYADYRVLSASDFGVPQKRQRLFVIGVRKDVGDRIGINSDELVKSVFPLPTRAGVTIRAAFDGLVQTPDDVWPWTRSAMVGSLARLMRLLPKNPPKPTRLAHVIPGYKKHYTLTRCSWDRPAPTMVVSGQRPDGLTGAIHPEKDRKFTLPELKRLTGLPDDFVLTGTLSQASERVCRMVPPLLTKAIAESVYTKVLLPYAEKKK
jgi:DNA-cytosine methyltransferase